MTTSTESEGPGLSSGQLKMVFPYHIAVDSNFNVTQVGDKLKEFLSNYGPDIIGNRIEHNFNLTSPPKVKWNWNQIWASRSTTFHVKVALSGCFHQLPLKGRWVLPDTKQKCFDMGGPNSAVLLLDLDISTTEELEKYGLSPSHLSQHGAKRDQLMSSAVNNFRLKFDHDNEVRKLREEAFRTQRTLESKRAFVRYISHEIRTPLNIVMMGLQLLAETGERSIDGLDDVDGVDATLPPLDTSSIGLVTDMRESCAAAVEILSDLLLSEKIEDNLMTVEATESNITKLVSDVVRLFKIPAQNKKIALSTDLSGAAGALADLDRNKFNQVVRNLVSNALKFTPSGGRVIVTAERFCEDAFPLVMAQSSIRSNPSVLQRLSCHNLMKLCQTPAIVSDIPAGLVTINEFEPTVDPNFGCIVTPTASISNISNNPIRSLIVDSATPRVSLNSGRSERRGCGCCLRCPCDALEMAQLSNINSPRKVRKVDETTRKHRSSREDDSRQGLHTAKSPTTDVEYNSGSGVGIGSNFRSRSNSSVSGNGSLTCGISGKNGTFNRQKSIQSEVSLFASMSSTTSAFKSSPSGGSAESLKLNSYGSSRQMLRIRVTDTGPGITPEDQRMLFTQFTQIKAGQLQNGGGSGLGLWVSRSIMQAHGGDIGVISKCSGTCTGSTFYIDLPILDKVSLSPYASDLDLNLHSQTVVEEFTSSERDGDVDSCSITDSTISVSEHAYSVGMSLSDRSNHQGSDNNNTISQSQTPPRNHLAQFQLKLPLAPINTVLIVDDSTTNRKFVSKLLKRHAKSIIEACDGQEAVNMCAGRPEFDVIMMDFVMPVMDGPSSVRELRRRGYRGLVIGVTGNLQQSDVEAFLMSGVDRVMMKPLDVEQFLSYALEVRDVQA